MVYILRKHHSRISAYESNLGTSEDFADALLVGLSTSASLTSPAFIRWPLTSAIAAKMDSSTDEHKSSAPGGYLPLSIGLRPLLRSMFYPLSMN